jgi:uncharacterized protein YndB with AHSA1/START domain
MSPTHPLGEILRTDGRATGLRFERRLMHPPQRVWWALTESDELRHWFPADIVGERRAGAEVVVTFWDDVAEKHAIADPVLTGRILTWDPPRRFVWSWDDEILTFDLVPDGGGTILTLEVQLGSNGPGADLVGAGYHVCLDQLVALVETDDPPPFLDQDPSAYEVRYAALLAGTADAAP